MELPPFALDQWLSKHDFSSPPIAYNLGSSTGPRWTLREVLELGGPAAALDEVVLSYSPAQGARALRQAVAAFHGVDPDWVVVTTGASEALSILLCLTERPGGNVVIPDPSYPAYAAMAAAWRLEARCYTLDRADAFAQRADAVTAATTPHTVTAIVNTPHNPSGSVMDRETVPALAAALAGRGVPLILDEVYHPLYFGPAQPSAAGIDNVIVISDLSKALSLPGLRMGWIIDRDAERRRRIIDARSYFTISHSPVLEQVATHALRNWQAIVARAQVVADENLAQLERTIARAHEQITWAPPQGSTTAFPRFRDGRDSRPFCEALADRGVLVAPGDCFGHPEHIRIGFAQQTEGFEIALATISRLLDDV